MTVRQTVRPFNVYVTSLRRILYLANFKNRLDAGEQFVKPSLSTIGIGIKRETFVFFFLKLTVEIANRTFRFNTSTIVKYVRFSRDNWLKFTYLTPPTVESFSVDVTISSKRNPDS